MHHLYIVGACRGIDCHWDFILINPTNSSACTMYVYTYPVVHIQIRTCICIHMSFHWVRISNNSYALRHVSVAS